MAKVGIFVCECGGNIGDVIDVKQVVNSIRGWKNIAVTERHEYLCSKSGQEIIAEAIKRGIDRVVVAACTPRMHLVTFQSVLETSRLNSYMLEFVNIREHDSWVHGPKLNPEATRKAINLIRGGYERCLNLEPLEMIREKCFRDVLIIGGGVAGITAALELADLGFKVYLVEREPSIGGNMAKLTKVFPTLDCAQCILTPRMAEVARNLNVRILANAEIKEVSGYAGNFKVKVIVKPRFVKENACNCCNECVKVCPIEVPSEFDENLGPRKAIYIPFPQAVPPTYIIDLDHCIQCYKCVEVCTPRAIDFSQEPQEINLEVGAIILATGYQLYDASKLEIYGYSKYENVITMMDLERLTSGSGPTGGYIRGASGDDVRKIAIVLCAGSRDKNYIPYCSRICCMYSLKQAFIMKKMLGIDVTVYYVDIRAAGKGYEDLYWRAQEAGVIFIRGKVAEIWRNNSGKLVVQAEDTLTGEVREDEYDMVALAVPMVPPSGFKELAEKLKVPLGEDGFVTEKHPKLDPVDSLRAGIFACGCSLNPKDVRDTVSDALGAAARVASLLKSDYITTSPEKAFVVAELCDGCGECVKICPVNAVAIHNAKARVDPFQCVGCGACVPSCPKEAIEVKNATTKQLLSSLRGILAEKISGEVRIIAFVDKSVGYVGIDFLGLDKENYSENIYVVAVPSTAILGSKYILAAFSYGADGILVIEGSEEIYEKFTKKRIGDIGKDLTKFGIESMRLRHSYIPLPTYRKAKEIFVMFTERIKKLGPLSDEKREKLRQNLGISD